MKLLLFDLQQVCEGLSHTKIKRFIESFGILSGRGCKIGGRYRTFAITPEEAENLLGQRPSPAEVSHVHGLVEYAVGSLPWLQQQDRRTRLDPDPPRNNSSDAV